MSLTITNATLTTTFDSTEVDTNFADVSNKFGNIDNSDIKAAAGIAASKLAASYQEVWLQLSWNALTLTGTWPAAAADPLAPTKDEVMDFVPLPGSDADTAWVATDVSWMCDDTGTASAIFDVVYGGYNGAGNMIGQGYVKDGATITFIAADKGNQGRGLEGGSVTLTQSATVRGLYLVSGGAGTVAMDDQGGANTMPSGLKVTVALRRQITA